MAWIELHQEVRNHPKIQELARLLGISNAEATGYIINLWLFCAAYAQNGNLTNFSDDQLARACDFTCNVSVTLLKQYLIQTRLLDEKNGKITVHDWKKHGLRLLSSTKDRVRKYRQQKKLQQSGKRNGNVTVTSTLPNPTLPNHTIPNTTTVRQEFSSLFTPEFEKSWDEWIVYRREIKKPLKSETAIKKQLKFLAEQPNPVACIEQSIRNNWQGLFEDKNHGNSTGKNGTAFNGLDPAKYPGGFRGTRDH